VSQNMFKLILTSSILSFVTSFLILILGSVEFGPEVTSSDKSIKVMLNSQDKVRMA